MKAVKISAAIALALTVSHTSVAFNDDLGGEVDVFSVLDLDHDGRISMEEITVGIYQMIQKDTDGDHYLSREELVTTEDYSHFMAMFDFNKDGRLTASEIPPAMLDKLMAMDKDGNHFLTMDELETTEDFDHFMQGFSFGQFDKNNDGKLSAAELPAAMVDKLMKMDKDGDHFLTAEELQVTEDYDHFARYDLNKDGKLTAVELPDAMRGKLMLKDRNNDHVLTREELVATEDYRHFMAMFDFNKDGRLSASEIPPAMLDKLMAMDKDGDHFLVIDELTGESDTWSR